MQQAEKGSLVGEEGRNKEKGKLEEAKQRHDDEGEQGTGEGIRHGDDTLASDVRGLRRC